MAEERYGGYGRREAWRERGSSIFSDEDDERRRRGSGRWSSDFGEGGAREDERGFFDRAGDEVRSWFGDEEAERRREADMQRDDARYAFGGRDYDRRYGSPMASRTPYGGYGEGRGYERGAGADYAGGTFRESGSYAPRSFGGRSGMVGRSQWDENYRRWRDQQIEQFDREYEEYCRERQHRFDQDFDSWRSSRLTEVGTSGSAAGSAIRERPASDYGGGRTRAQGRAEDAGATTSAGGTASATRASTGSAGAAAAGEEGSVPARSRGGRTRG